MRELINDPLSELKQLHGAYLGGSRFPDATDEYRLRAFAGTYGTTEFQTLVLADLVYKHPTCIGEAELTSLYDGCDEATSETEIRDLLERRFIKRGITCEGSPCYQMDEAAYRALREHRHYGKKDVDCYRKLRESSLASILSHNWKTSFYAEAAGSVDGQINDAVEAMGVKQLPSDVQDAFWALVWQFCNRFTVPFAFRSTGGLMEGVNYNEDRLKTAMGELVKIGLAGTIPIEPLEETKDTERYVLGVKPVELLFRGREEFIRYDDISKQVNVILARDITPKELFFTEDVQKEIDSLRKLLSPEGFHRASEILRGRKRNPGIHMLLWGPPGTGKTEVIKQMARESGRDILLVDVAKMTQCGWGGTEKCYRALFLGYSYIVAISVNAPILVMNEADHILSRRLTEVSSAIAKSENAISNILLQGFEDMSGILLATTNLIKNMDEAFDRRFLFKIMLPKPGPDARKNIWKSSVPELSDSEAEILADKFEMSGGQISNVAAKRDLAELYYEGDRGFEFIVDLCRIEVKEPIQTTGRKIGF